MCLEININTIMFIGFLNLFHIAVNIFYIPVTLFQKIKIYGNKVAVYWVGKMK